MADGEDVDDMRQQQNPRLHWNERTAHTVRTTINMTSIEKKEAEKKTHFSRTISECTSRNRHLFFAHSYCMGTRDMLSLFEWRARALTHSDSSIMFVWTPSLLSHTFTICLSLAPPSPSLAHPSDLLALCVSFPLTQIQIGCSQCTDFMWRFKRYQSVVSLAHYDDNYWL